MSETLLSDSQMPCFNEILAIGWWWDPKRATRTITVFKLFPKEGGAGFLQSFCLIQ